MMLSYVIYRLQLKEIVTLPHSIITNFQSPVVCKESEVMYECCTEVVGLSAIFHFLFGS